MGGLKLFSVDDEMLQNVAALFGEEAVRVVEILEKVGETTDFQIADQTEIRLNIVRRTLYRLYDHSLVGLRRTRDKETGWFVFHWRLQPDQFGGFITNRKRHILEKLEARLTYEANDEFYSCQTQGCRPLPFGQAFEVLFRCPACNKPMVHVNNGQIIEVITRKIEQIKRELSEQPIDGCGLPI
ncbi:MAG: transcription factor [Candidatus Bathyarchaeota archaeon]|nr:transcription factor [Candidatus Bathyarchaeota archaeon]